jgi:hypothetical protein
VVIACALYNLVQIVYGACNKALGGCKKKKRIRDYKNRMKKLREAESSMQMSIIHEGLTPQ